MYSSTNHPTNSYVYAYMREDANTPYYIGKGKGRRAWNQHRTTKGGIKTPDDNSRIVILEENLTDDEAISLEIELIKKYGRKDLGTGILRNTTDGGEGAAGGIPWNKGKSWTGAGQFKSGVASWNKGIPMRESTKVKQRDKKVGKKQTAESNAKNSASNKGVPKSSTHKANISAGKKDIPQKQVVCPHCSKTGGISVMKRHHFDRCKTLIS